MKSLYIHVPFCIKRCGYCDFVSSDTCSNDTKDKYAKAVAAEITSLPAVELDTVFFGGGTPTSLTVKQLYVIMEAIATKHSFKDNCEISVEVNPETIDSEYALNLKTMGFNRISLGLQSADDKILSIIGRVHTFDRFKRAYDDIRHAGFNNVNIDIMYGLPQQTRDIFEDTIHKVMDFAPEHISAYELNLSDESSLGKAVTNESVLLPEEQEIVAMTDCLKELENIYPRYEVSNYAKEGYECRHNLNYWNNGSYFGVGCGAHGCLDKSMAHRMDIHTDGYRVRYEHTGDINEYIRSDVPVYTTIDINESMFETVMVGLRLVKGIDELAYNSRFNCSLYDILRDYIDKNPHLIKRDNGRIYLTARGMDIQNTVLCSVMEIFEGRKK